MENTLELVGMDLGPYFKLLVKWYFTNEKRVPKGIRFEDVMSPNDRDRGHFMEAQMARKEKAVIGEVREGRVETGTNFIHRLGGVSTGFSLDQLRNAGWGNVVTPHSFVQTPRAEKGKRNPRMKKSVVALNLMRLEDCKNPEDPSYDPWAMPEGSQDGFDILNNGSWSLDAWANPNGVLTLNFTMFNPSDPGTNALTVNEDNFLSAVSVTDLV